MKAVILAGGKGSRLGSLTKSIPKPMVKIGGKPILWHILKILSSNGIKDFIICLGYKGEIIRNYVSKLKEKWKIDCVDTGVNTLTARRIFLIKNKINEDIFLMTYGDGLANINLMKLLRLHNKKKTIATVTAVAPIPRFGSIKIKNDIVTSFSEKTEQTENLINGGFFLLNRSVFDFMDLSKNVMWEQEPMSKLTKRKQLAAYHHKDFWCPMDTERDQKFLNKLYYKGAPWKI
jgi:glucose-1-phosphate cytidylyltransferase